MTRAEWAAANLGAFEKMLAPAEERLAAGRRGLGASLAARLMGAVVSLDGVLAHAQPGQQAA